MTPIERYRELYEHEKYCNGKMLEMIGSVPETARDDPRFKRALVLAAHLAACRENWLGWMDPAGGEQAAWFLDEVPLESLAPRYAAIEERWTRYLAVLSDSDLAREFEFTEGDGSHWKWYVEGQIVQLVEHAPYHRGQVAMLVDMLGGETVDTDYVFWVYEVEPSRFEPNK